jgi:hypothetical protein
MRRGPELGDHGLRGELATLYCVDLDLPGVAAGPRPRDLAAAGALACAGTRELSFLARVRVFDVDAIATRVGAELRAWPGLGGSGRDVLAARRPSIENALRGLFAAWTPVEGAVLDLGFAALAAEDDGPAEWRFFQELHAPVAGTPRPFAVPSDARAASHALGRAWGTVLRGWTPALAAERTEPGAWSRVPLTQGMDAAVERLRGALVAVAAADSAGDATAHGEFQRLCRQLVG